MARSLHIKTTGLTYQRSATANELCHWPIASLAQHGLLNISQNDEMMRRRMTRRKTYPRNESVLPSGGQTSLLVRYARGTGFPGAE